MSSARPIALAFAASFAGAVLAHGARLAGAPPEAFAGAAAAALAVIAAGTALGVAVLRLAGGNRTVAAGAAALFAAHPAFASLGRGEVAPVLSTPWTLFAGAACAFVGAALRRDPFAPAPPLRRDGRRRTELTLYVLGASAAPGLTTAPAFFALADLWFHPDAPAAWRRSVVRTAVAATGLAALAGYASHALGGGVSGGAEGFSAAAASAFGLRAPGALRFAPYGAWAALFLPAGILSRPAAAPKATLLATGVLGAGLVAAGLAAAVFTPTAPTLGVAGLAVAFALAAWRAASALIAPDADGETAPIPSVPALRDALAAVDHERGPLAAGPAFAPIDPAAVAATVREAVVDAWESLRPASPAANGRLAVPLGPDRREPLDDPETAWRRYVRDELFPRLRAARTVGVVGEPPLAVAEALAERVRLVRLDESGEDARPAKSAPCDAVVSFRGHELLDVGAVVRHVAALRRLVRRDGAVGVVTVTAADTPAPPAWDFVPEAPR